MSYYFKDNQLDERKQAYCRCEAHLYGKQSLDCLAGKKFGQGKCYSPFQVCRKSTGTGTKECSKHFNFEGFPDNELMGYAYYHNIPVPKPYDRKKMLNNIQVWKKEE